MRSPDRTALGAALAAACAALALTACATGRPSAATGSRTSSYRREDGHHRRAVRRRPGRLSCRAPARPGHNYQPRHCARLAALSDGLPLSTIPPDAPCPFGLGRFLSLTFRARSGGPAVAIVQTDQACGAVTLTVRGERQPALQNELLLDGTVLELAAVPWKLS
jgi:hypothetical protein